MSDIVDVLADFLLRKGPMNIEPLTVRQRLAREILDVLAATPAVGGEASETWAYIERLLHDECGLRLDEGLEGQRVNCINAIKNGASPAINNPLLQAAIEFLNTGEGLHKIRVNGKMMHRKDVAAALAAPPDSPLRGRDAIAESLKPFAKAWEAYGDKPSDDTRLSNNWDESWLEGTLITFGDLRRASLAFAAISASPPEQPSAVKMYRDALDAANVRIAELEDRLSKAAFAAPPQSQ